MYSPKSNAMTVERKKELDEAAIECIIDDSRSFGDFRRSGMQLFLSVATPGYKGPHRKTVSKNLEKLYYEHRDRLRRIFSTVNDIALTSDIWKNSRRTYFICLTAHYYNSSFQYISLVIGFRRLQGRKISTRLYEYIRYELEQLRIRSKIRSITTDNGSDIKAATSNTEFGIRISCLAHNLNLTVSNGLGLWKKLKDNEGAQPKVAAASTIAMDIISKDDDEASLIDEAEIGDDDSIDDQESSCSIEYVVDKSEPISLRHEEEPADSSGEDEDEQQQKRQAASGTDLDDDSEEREEMTILLSKPNRVVEKVFILLRQTRSLIKLIRKSNILDAYVRQEAKRKQIEHEMTVDNQKQQTTSSSTATTSTERKSKFTDLIIDLHIRWNSTYVMLDRFIVYREIVNVVTHNPTLVVGLDSTQREKLKKLSYSHTDWDCLLALKNVLFPFYRVTELLSARNYQTLEKQQEQKKTGLEQLFIDCNAESPAVTRINTGTEEEAMTVKEEIALLTTIVRRYNIIAATSVASESAFSIAGYVQRKQRASLAPTTLRQLMILRDYQKLLTEENEKNQ
ncbi:unnamed protein product [Didymodactylos carnosus]|uniref:HAT C-terminal dimerisation domain-containing protein n=1 Tax=Didymodactylos carnosus TaxID=1234261 RepID=A0A815SZ50_9BILA|nr:unnamed protein product [Didymodactylos carnosus]CAF1496341.1 unnamed protein product [Didymodactylos carnosus]CAF4095750.1 unnamed protein product [Didymodactylos carnosus]CAF4358744.1 unnamed protein product [Didymodactylos carnosus]